ncbi:chemotaxis protein CheA [uncultured Clostridium sp.]|uniref:chemotaxis protein CheA n=1 Tax=uncultured Clostridium sp. TaxID=59620 RepID=UPI0026039416|nr:chemotaxis protein CheA [uncultured Clostridium sp.]
MDTSQYLSMFLEESRENLRVLNDTLLDLEQEPNDLDKIAQIFRVAHTIKGMAATMGFATIAELTHKMEDVLSKFRDGQLKITADVVTVLFKCLDMLERMVDKVEDGDDEVFDITEMIKLLEKSSIISDKEEVNKDTNEKEFSEENMELNEYDVNIIKQAQECGFNSFKIDITLSETTLLKSARVFLMFQDLEEVGEVIKSAPSTQDIEDENFEFSVKAILITQITKSELEKIIVRFSEMSSYNVENIDLEEIKKRKEVDKASKEVIESIEVKDVDTKIKVDKVESKDNKVTTKKVHKPTHQSVRVELDKLDKLINMVSELVINRTRLEQIAADQKCLELNETLEQVARTTSDLQDLVMKIRMLPLDVVFNRFPRMIRDVSVDLGKEVNFVIEGKETELDRTVIDEIGEPLIHLLRNAIDHGVESKEERVKAGKKGIGTISLIAYQEGTKAVIKVQDDGAGINIERVKAKAKKVGIETDGLSDDEVKNLIFSSGFSTNEKVTDISGRGVGMDVVKTKIGALGGTVDVISEEGVGSTFIIKLPLTLQIIQALLVKVGEENFAISLGFIDRVIDFSSIDIKKSNNKEVIIYRDRVIPLLRLDEYFSIDIDENNKERFIVVVKVGDKEIGLLVDSLLGQQEVVIKLLGNSLSNIKEYIGATILGNGLVTLILDVAAFV